MLVEFSVENYRSIKNEACLSLVASSDKKSMQRHIVVPHTMKNSNSSPLLLRSAAIYGANAAGKTNLLRALSAMKEIVINQQRDTESIPVTPFLFDPACRDKPSTFEVICFVNGVRYQYGFSVTSDRVIEEWLYAYPKGRTQTWFQRSNDSWKLGNKLLGNKEIWRQATRPDTLYLTTAVSLNSKQLRPLFDWFKKNLHVATKGRWNSRFSISKVRENDKSKSEIIAFLQAADLGISDLRVSEKEFSPNMIPENAPTIVKDIINKDIVGRKLPQLWLSHDAGHSELTEIKLSEESGGTQKIFALAGPWLDTLQNGHVIVVDELNEKLHPTLVRFLVERFHDPNVNSKGAQLIFSTHDTSILSHDVFRRDQIWFCERNRRQETELFSLVEFRPRKGSNNLERAYLSGRYGAIPFVDINLVSE